MLADRQSRVIGINGAQGVSVAGQVEFYSSQSVLGAQKIDFALADAPEPFQRGMAAWAVSIEVRIQWSNALPDSLDAMPDAWGRDGGCCEGCGMSLEPSLSRIVGTHVID